MLVYLFQKSKISIIKNKVEIKSNKIGPIVSKKIKNHRRTHKDTNST